MLRLPLPTVLLLLLQTLGGAVAEDWKARRSELVRHLFGTDGSLPARSQPDFIEAVPGPQAQGCLCAARGHCNTTECQWDNNMTKLTWTLESKLPTESKVKGVFNNASGSYIRLNSTVFHTLNTSTSAPAYHGWSAMMPKDGDGGQPHIYPTQQTRTLVLFHQGHDVPHDVCQTDNNGEVEWLNTLGYDVMELEMPFLGCNWHEGLPEEDHVWFQQFEAEVPVMRFFLEPIILTINYAVNVLKYDKIVMMGLSGGGWSTTIAAAVDPRIQLSMPTAGSIPCEFKHTSWDYEQWGPCGVKDKKERKVLTTMSRGRYVMAALEPERTSIQIIHEHDPCCFHGFGRHERIIAYNEWVATQVEGHFETVPTIGNIHEVNVRDKTVAGMLIDNLSRKGKLGEADYAAIPYNTLHEWGP